MPIGELFDLEKLAAYCEKNKRYSFFLTSEPCNVSRYTTSETQQSDARTGTRRRSISTKCIGDILGCYRMHARNTQTAQDSALRKENP